MWMTEYEIVQSFLRAANHKEQIKILSELNECNAEAIVRILEKRSRVSDTLLSKALGKKTNIQKSNDNIPTSFESNEVGILKKELRNAYSLCIELEEENRRLQHEIILMLKDILVSVSCG